MTATDLINSIFSRHQDGVPVNQRRITQGQYDFLAKLVSEGPEAGAFRPYGPGEMVWAPRGRHKYILTEAAPGRKRTLTRLNNVAAEAASLF